MTPAGTVRDATRDDAGACAAIYAPYVVETAITFETEPPSAADFAGRIAAAQSRWAWLVLEREGRVVGYAYAGQLKGRAAYDWACEVSVYLEAGLRRSGAGRALYAALLERLEARGYRQALACMTLPNAASEGLHRAMGFEPAGTWTDTGYKHGAWHSVLWLQKQLGPGGASAPTGPV